MPHAALLIIGSEMLDPDRRDANGPLARQQLAELGIPLALIARVEDTIPAIAAALTAALETADVVITSGGIGPTGDDLTREGVAQVLGCGIHEDLEWSREIENRLASRGWPLSELGRRQAHVLDGAERIPNGRGLACGSFVEAGARCVAILPGVPVEFSQMFAEWVIPRLAERFPDRPSTRVIRAIAAGLPESHAEPILLPWYRRPGVAVSILPVSGVLKITFTLTAPPAEDLPALEAEARTALQSGLSPHLVSLDGRLLEEVIPDLLLARNWKLASAESCTGGSVARKIVSIAGASRYYVGGVEAYDNRIKTELLGVSRETLERHGAVSPETALEMARGACRRFGADCAVATTGIAGPDGGTPEKPVGLVQIAAVTPEAEFVTAMRYPLGRTTLMELAANQALYRLWRLLLPTP